MRTISPQKLAATFSASAVAAALFTFSPAAPAQDEHQHEKEITKAIAVLQPTKGSKVQGIVTFTKIAQGIHVEATITGLEVGKHGFHIHQYGDLASPDGEAAGYHFNPTGEPHGGPGATKRHLGDLGNITADTIGPAKYSNVNDRLAFDGPNSILGRSVVVHADADDLITPPGGRSGARLAVGVIGVAKTK